MSTEKLIHDHFLFQAPYSISISTTALVVMDTHAHLAKTEVIGLLGGHYDGELGELVIMTAEPCDSLSTSMQCEMDPGELNCELFVCVNACSCLSPIALFPSVLLICFLPSFGLFFIPIILQVVIINNRKKIPSYLVHI